MGRNRKTITDYLQDTPDGGLEYVGPDVTVDFSKLTQVPVRYAKPSVIDAQANDCINNAVWWAHYDTDLEVIQGWLSRTDCPDIGIFHYWNRCKETGVYYDSTPLSDRSHCEYWIEK